MLARTLYEDIKSGDNESSKNALAKLATASEVWKNLCYLLQTVYILDNSPITLMTLLLLLVLQKLGRSLNLPCHLCDGRITLFP